MFFCMCYSGSRRFFLKLDVSLFMRETVTFDLLIVICHLFFVCFLRFDLIHKQFTSLTQELEQLIGAYVNVMFSKSKRTHEGLTILASFEPICERNYLRSILRDAYVNLFLSKFLHRK